MDSFVYNIPLELIYTIHMVTFFKPFVETEFLTFSTIEICKALNAHNDFIKASNNVLLDTFSRLE